MNGSLTRSHWQSSYRRREAPSFWIIALPLALGYILLSALIRMWEMWGLPTLQWETIVRTALLEIVLLLLVMWISHRLITARLLNPLRRAAEVDDLTGLLRAGAFWTQAEEQVDAGYRTGQTTAFVFLDLDDFKQINDTQGHLTGDTVLRQMAHLLRKHVRAEDIVGRLGGEEFGWLLPRTTADEALQAAARVLEECKVTTVDGVSGFTFSAGVTAVTGTEPDPLSAWDLARDADRAQYLAKGTGKGKIICN